VVGAKLEYIIYQKFPTEKNPTNSRVLVIFISDISINRQTKAVILTSGNKIVGRKEGSRSYKILMTEIRYKGGD
jgi:hypothetical protein